METIDIVLLCLFTFLLLLFLTSQGFDKDRNDDGKEIKEGYRRGWRHWGWWGPGWGRRRNWIWW